MKATSKMIKDALATGATVEKEPEAPKPEPAPVPPPPPEIDLEALSAPIRELVQSLQAQMNAAQEQLQASQSQNEELRAMVKAIMAEKPMRLKPIRDMDPNSVTYLLTEHIDLIPLNYKPKLNS